MTRRTAWRRERGGAEPGGNGSSENKKRADDRRTRGSRQYNYNVGRGGGAAAIANGGRWREGRAWQGRGVAESPTSAAAATTTTTTADTAEAAEGHVGQTIGRTRGTPDNDVEQVRGAQGIWWVLLRANNPSGVSCYGPTIRCVSLRANNPSARRSV